MASHQLILRIS